MNSARLSWTYLWSRPLGTVLNLALLSIGLASVTLVLLVSRQVDQAFERDLAGIDAVVGAKGSPMQLILSGVFHIDVPPGNIPLEAVNTLRAHPQVAQVIPISLGDSWQGWRIVGTEPTYLGHYQARFAQGGAWAQSMDAVLGHQVAQATGLALGGQFLGSHGLAPGGHEHGDFPYTVTGVLQPCACVLDRLILTPTESVWQVHEKATALDEADAQALAEEREITLALVRYSTPLAAVTFPRYINSATNWQAAAPAQEISRLLRLVGVGTDVLRGFGVVLLLSAALSVFIGLWNAVRERRADLAMLRMLGAPPQRLAWLLVCEALWLAALACVLGLALGHGLTAALGAWLQADRSLAISGWVLLPEQTLVVLAAGLVALGAALLPAWAAYRLDVSRLLQER